MDHSVVWIVAILGFGTLLGVFFRMRPGFGPMSLRAVGIVLIATFASILALENKDSLSAAMGILGAIGGYLFGTKSIDNPKELCLPKNGDGKSESDSRENFKDTGSK